MGEGGRPLWQTVVSIGLSLATVVGAGAFVIRVLREQRSERSRLIRRDSERTRLVTRDLRRGREIPDQDRALAQAVLDGTHNTRLIGLVMLGGALSLVFSTATRPDTLAWLGYTSAAFVLATAVLVVATTVALRRGAARIGLHPGGGV